MNISIVLIGTLIWTDQNEIEISPKSTRTLLNFLRYRQDFLNENYSNDYAHFLTASKFDNGILGKSRKDGICSSTFSGGFSGGFESGVDFVSIIVAHEIGHSLGISHDTAGCFCEDNSCIMTSGGAANGLPTEWSSCSFQEAQNASSEGLYWCLR